MNLPNFSLWVQPENSIIVFWFLDFCKRKSKSDIKNVSKYQRILILFLKKPRTVCSDTFLRKPGKLIYPWFLSWINFTLLIQPHSSVGSILSHAQCYPGFLFTDLLCFLKIFLFFQQFMWKFTIGEGENTKHWVLLKSVFYWFHWYLAVEQTLHFEV